MKTQNYFPFFHSAGHHYKTTMSHENAWWKGTRGEWFVVIQVMLFMLVIFGPPTLYGLPDWVTPYAQLGWFAGSILIAAGVLFIGAGLWELRDQLTALPFPREDARFIETGPYALVRHPIYTGGIFLAFGWALWIHGWLTIVYALLLFVFFDIKARREEHWLSERFSVYPDYQRRVRRLLPFLY
jgi:protein-S-isoprenylcysteine O-methyltransferase Ste14